MIEDVEEIFFLNDYIVLVVEANTILQTYQGQSDT